MTATPPSPIPPIGPTTGMGLPAGPSRFKPVDPLRLLRQYFWVLLALLAVGVSLGLGTWYLLRTYKPGYTSTTFVPFEPRTVDPMSGTVGSEGMGSIDHMRAHIETEIQHLMNEEMLREAVLRPEVRNTQWYTQFQKADGSFDVVAAVRALRNDTLSATVPARRTMMLLTVTTEHADDAQNLLDAVLAVYRRRIEFQTESESRQLQRTFESEVARADEEITNFRNQRDLFLKEEDLGNLQSRFSVASLNYQTVASQQLSIATSLTQTQQQLAMAKRVMETGDYEPTADVRYEIEQTIAIERRNEKLRDAREMRDAALSRFGPEHYSVRRMDENILAIEAEKEREILRIARERQAASIESLSKHVEMLQANLADHQARLEDARTRMADFNRRLAQHRQIESQLEAAEERRSQFNNALMTLRLEGERTDTVRARKGPSASRPELTFPKARVIVPGVTLLVVGLGMGLIVLREMLDQRVKAPSDVNLLGEVDLLGVLPDASEDPVSAARVERAVQEHPTGLMAESFRRVRTALLARMDRRGYKTLVISSALPGGGASSTAQNLAASVAANGRHVLLVDANFRRPAQAKLAGVPESPGLFEVLRGEAEVTDAVVELEQAGLALLPVGDAHKAQPELLEGAPFRALLGQLETRYDLIIIDAPPALLTTDTQLLAKYVDAMALVVRADRDKRGMVERMVRQLDGQRADVLGLILNGVRSSAGGYFRKSYREFYQYSANGNGKAAPALQRRLPAPPVEAAEESKHQN